MNKVNYDATLNDLVELWSRKNIDIEIGILNGERPTETEAERTIKDWVLQTVKNLLKRQGVIK